MRKSIEVKREVYRNSLYEVYLIYYKLLPYNSMLILLWFTSLIDTVAHYEPVLMSDVISNKN
jgi:hypothetical protein